MVEFVRIAVVALSFVGALWVFGFLHSH
jgi:hypothetical protein